MGKVFGSLVLCAALLLSCGVSACAASSGTAAEVLIQLSDSGVQVNGAPAPTSDSAAVYTGATILYYQDGTDSTYGEGTPDEMHSPQEAAAHTVVTITQPGTYRLTGTLSQGQIFVDLGEDAPNDPDAVVTLILDNADITCTVAPAVFFYSVYECGFDDVETASPVVDTSAAGANVILAAGSENNITGSHVARIYREGTTENLHRYDGAFYSRMSMNLFGDGDDDSGILNIVADNEGLDTELHLTINGGTIHIDAQDDGINTNEDFVSVTTINGGTLTINAGQGTEGDGIDSNGYLTINGGTIWTMSNESAPDGGIDAGLAITINGGTLYAFGTRNDAVSTDSQQPYMELSFASTLPAGSVITILNPQGETVMEATSQKNCQSFTFSSDQLQENIAYAVYVDGVQQQYTGNRSGMMGGGRPQGGQPPEGGDPGQLPEDFDPSQLPDGFEPRQGRPNGQPPEGFDPGQPPQDFDPSQEEGEASTEFTLTESIHAFSGVSDSPDSAGKTRVSFTVNGGQGMRSVASGESVVLSDIQASVDDLPDSDVQITITDVPSEDYAQTCLLSDGPEALADLLPTDDGTYRLTVAVSGSNETYAGVSQWEFTIGVLPFRDVREDSSYYGAVKAVYDAGVMEGTGENTFSPEGTVTRAQAVTVLARLAQAQSTASDAFTDVAQGSWYSGYVGWAAEKGIVLGDGAGHFLPEQPVTGQQMDLMISRYAQLAGLDYTASSSSTTPLTRAELAVLMADLLSQA